MPPSTTPLLLPVQLQARILARQKTSLWAKTRPQGWTPPQVRLLVLVWCGSSRQPLRPAIVLPATTPLLLPVRLQAGTSSRRRALLWGKTRPRGGEAAAGDTPRVGVVRFVRAATPTSDRAAVNAAVAPPAAAAGGDVVATEDVTVGKDAVAGGEAAAGETPHVGVGQLVPVATPMADAAANLAHHSPRASAKKARDDSF